MPHYRSSRVTIDEGVDIHFEIHGLSVLRVEEDIAGQVVYRADTETEAHAWIETALQTERDRFQAMVECSQVAGREDAALENRYEEQ